MNNTKENDAFQIDHVKSKENDAQIKKKQIHSQDKKSKFTRKTDTQRNSKRFQNNVNKRFQTTKPTTLTRTRQRI